MPDTTLGLYSEQPSWSMSGGGGGNAFGSAPGPVSVGSTAGTAVPQAISAGQQVYSQLPGYMASLGNVGQNIGAETAGQLPADVINQLQQQAAERGVSTGSPGSPNSNASYLQSLGLNSLALTQTGQSNLQSILQSLPGASIASNPNFYVTPQQQYEAALQNAIDAAAPNPGAAQGAGLRAAQQGFGAGLGGGGIPGLSPGTGTMSPDAFMAAGGPGTVVLQGGGGGTYGDTTGTSDTMGVLNGIVGTYAPTGTSSGAGSTYIQQPGSTYDPTMDPSSPSFDPYAAVGAGAGDLVSAGGTGLGDYMPSSDYGGGEGDF